MYGRSSKALKGNGEVRPLSLALSVSFSPSLSGSLCASFCCNGYYCCANNLPADTNAPLILICKGQAQGRPPASLPASSETMMVDLDRLLFFRHSVLSVQLFRFNKRPA